MGIEGFDGRWADFPAYIIGITREIWEERGIAALEQYYAGDVVVRTPLGMTRGRRPVVTATTAALAEFPDRKLLAEDVIWSGDPAGGLLSSHRIISTATHAIDGPLGRATGARLTYRVIADCAARNGQIFDEWLVRDNGAIVRQSGRDPKAFAADLIAREGGPQACTQPFRPAQDIDGGYHGRGNDHPLGKRYAEIMTRLMAADFAVIRAAYDRAVQVELPGGITGHGHAQVDRFWLGLRASFPDAELALHHVIGRTDAEFAPRAAIRWSLSGRHDGWGMFGPPSGAEIHVMGISHAEFGPWGLRREYVLFDEVAIWKQILLKTG